MGTFIHRRKAEKRAANKRAALPKTAEAKTENTPVEAVTESSTETSGSQATMHTKTEINRAGVEELRKIADELGIKGSRGMTGGELKKLLIEQLGL